MKPSEKHPPRTWSRKCAIAHRLLVLSAYRFLSLIIVGSLPLLAHTLISMQSEVARDRTWVAPELWLLSLVMWGTAFAEAIIQERGGLRCYLIRWASCFAIFISA